VTTLSALPAHLLVTGCFIALLLVGFIALFLMPGVIHWFRLGRIQRALSMFKAPTPPAELKKLFSPDRRLAHLWGEYQDTLHVQREESDGRMDIVAVRSTIPASAYFSAEYLVDSRLRTEFFKHLPGIFTGVGIIGTFTGLIEGLRRFQVSENAATVRASLESLMHSVGEAFLISAAAIGAAMLVTVIEKMMLAGLYRKAEEIAHAIDAQFNSGAGEEYLARLVTASEASATQSKILKDALVKELGDILRELTAAQLAANRDENKALAGAIASSIENSLKTPLERIAETVKTASGDQSATAVQMLNDVMVSFSQRLNDLFGGQISGINELNKQTAQGMQDAVSALQNLVGKLGDNNKQATEQMAAQMTASIRAIEERQAQINAESTAFIEQLQKAIEGAQSKTQEKIEDTLESMGSQITALVTSLNETHKTSLDSNRAREEAMAGRAGTLVAGMTGSVEVAVREITAASTNMAQSVAALSAATTSSIDKLNIGAERLNTAAVGFATAGDRVSAAMGQATTVSNRLTEVSGSLTASANAVEEALRDYRAQREAITKLLAEVRATIELARKEAGLTSDVLQRLESSTAKLGTAQKAVESYLDGVSEVLAESNAAFRDSVVATLSNVNYDFHSKLSGAIGLLSSAISELEVTLGSSAPKR
jgi:hypothetical protein